MVRPSCSSGSINCALACLLVTNAPAAVFHLVGLGWSVTLRLVVYFCASNVALDPESNRILSVGMLVLAATCSCSSPNTIGATSLLVLAFFAGGWRPGRVECRVYMLALRHESKLE